MGHLTTASPTLHERIFGAVSERESLVYSVNCRWSLIEVRAMHGAGLFGHGFSAVYGSHAMSETVGRYHTVRPQSGFVRIHRVGYFVTRLSAANCAHLHRARIIRGAYGRGRQSAGKLVRGPLASMCKSGTHI